MRIIGGKFKGRRFTPPADHWPTRPTTDFAKEGLFNILSNSLDFEELKVLDLFGGTGSHSYELISRGCTDVTYVDKFGPAVAFARKMARLLEIEPYIKIVQSDVFRYITHCKEHYDYIFAGPPYGLPQLEEIPELVFSHALLRPGGWLVLEHNPHHSFEAHSCFIMQRNYGKTLFTFFEAP
ncbi:MAG: RsmD family RNA methyltransferase [Saprospiraceae bacterium]|jgi:16S rRNA (guanine966-N2)-methyltransferase